MIVQKLKGLPSSDIETFHSWVRCLFFAQTIFFHFNTILAIPGLAIMKAGILALTIGFFVCDFLFWHTVPHSHGFFPILVSEILLGVSLMLHSGTPGVSLRGMYLGIHFLIFLLVPLSFSQEHIDHEQNVMFIIGLIAAMVPLIGSFVVGFLARGIEPNNGPWFWDSMHHLWMGSNPNRWGRVIAILLMMLFFLIATCKKPIIRNTSLIMLVPASISLFFFQCRGALYFLFAFLFIYSFCLLYGKPKKQILLLVGWGGIGLLGLLMLSLLKGHADEFHLLEPPQSTSARTPIWLSALCVIRDNPLFGISIKDLLTRYSETVPIVFMGGNTHNEALSLALHGGIPLGCLVFGIFGYCLLYPLYKARSLFESNRFRFLYALLAALIVQGLVEQSIVYYNKMTAPVYFVVTGYILYEIGTFKQKTRT